MPELVKVERDPNAASDDEESSKDEEEDEEEEEDNEDNDQDRTIDGEAPKLIDRIDCSDSEDEMVEKV